MSALINHNFLLSKEATHQETQARRLRLTNLIYSSSTPDMIQNYFCKNLLLLLNYFVMYFNNFFEIPFRTLVLSNFQIFKNLFWSKLNVTRFGKETSNVTKLLQNKIPLISKVLQLSTIFLKTFNRTVVSLINVKHIKHAGFRHRTGENFHQRTQ